MRSSTHIYRGSFAGVFPGFVPVGGSLSWIRLQGLFRALVRADGCADQRRCGGHSRAAILGGVLDNSALYCQCKYMATIKEERLQIRVDPADKALLERAAAAAHLNVSAFVVQAAAARAEEILAERSSIRLSRDAAVAFTEALEQPGEVNRRLARALRRKRSFSWLD